MNKKRKSLQKSFWSIVLTLAMLITMLPTTMVSAQQDITGPGLNSYEMLSVPEGGYKSGDKIQLKISAYDTESEIAFVSAAIRTNDSTCGEPVMEFKGWVGEYSEISGIGVKKEADGSIVITDFIPENFYGSNCTIPEIRLEDAAGNAATYTTDISFAVQKVTDSTVNATVTSDVSNVVFDNTTVTKTINFTMSFTGNTKEIKAARAKCVGENGGTLLYNMYFEKNGDVFTSNNELKASWSTEGKYSIKDVIVYYEDGTSVLLANNPDYFINITNNITDKSAPVVTKIEMDKKGEILDTGTVKFTVTATDESAMADNGGILLVSGIDIAEPYRYVALTKVSDGVYEGTIDVTDLHNCDWRISSIEIKDAVGNIYCTTSLNFSDYWFGVIRNGVYQEGAYKYIDISFWYNYYFDNEPIKCVVKDIPKSGATLGDLLGSEYFEMSADPKLGDFLGWVDINSGKLYSKNTVVTVEHDLASVVLQPRYEKIQYTISMQELDKDGYWNVTAINHYADEPLTVDDLKNIIGKGEDVGESKFQDWELDEDFLESLDNGGNVRFMATYDKYPVRINMAYVDANGEVAIYNVTKNYNAGTTLQKAYDDAIAAIGSSNLSSVTGWRYGYEDLEEVLTWKVDESNWLTLMAEYADKQLVSYYFNYITENNGIGKPVDLDGVVVVNKSSLNSQEVLKKIIEKVGTVNHWDELTFLDYDVYTDAPNGVITNLSVACVYDNIILVGYAGEDSSVAYNVTPGQVVTLPTEVEGKQIGWFDYETDKTYYGSFTIPSNAVKGDVINLYATDETNDAIINESVPVQKPAVTLDTEKKEEVVADIQSAIKEAESTGKTQTIKVDMKNEDGKIATQVPKEILEVAKGKDVDVVLDMGGYSWTINGKDIKAENLKDINLEVTVDSNNIPSNTIKKLAGNKETHQLSLTHNGDFGFKADLTINVGAENVGQYGNLYYYDSTGKLVFMNAGKIDENGNVSLSFSHASEYVVVIDKEAAVPGTGDNTNIGLFVATLLAGVGLVVVSSKNKKRA